ncbi:MAG: metal-dependent hydrolase, partial [Deltaproteobacteria bacterium]|nr:metal-dependent hydrolase [Deltaproteobacteria bacterium]
MDTFTHVVTGAVIARAIDDEKIGKWGTLAGLVTAAFPDAG